MNSKRVFLGMVCLLTLFSVGLFFSVYQANGMLEHESKKLVGLKAPDKQLVLLEQQIQQDKKDLAQYANLNDVAKNVVPQDKDQAMAVRQIVALAAQSGIANLSSITFAQSTLGASAAPGGGLTQVTPVKGISGVYDLQITVTQAAQQEVPYSQFHTFLSSLEQNRRTVIISGITVTPDAKDPTKVAFGVVVDEYIKPTGVKK